MTSIDIQTTAKNIAEQTMPPSDGFGLVFEAWQRAWDNAMKAKVRASVPDEHQDSVIAELIEIHGMSDPNETSILDNHEVCPCGLDEMTCPNGHFEH